MKLVLIVDDDRDFAESLAELVDLEGYKPLLAHSGEEALELISQHEVDIVFMDIRMPNMDGVETIKKVRKLKPDVRVAMMTGYSDSNLIAAALKHGAVGVLNKPIEIDDLISTIERNGFEKVVLLVDDDKDFSDSLKTTLADHGYKVHIASNSHEAMDYVLNDNIKLMLLDLRLSNTNGLDVYHRLKQQGEVLPTIVVTAYANEERKQIEKLKSFSVERVFQKPFNVEELIEAIEEISA